MRRMDEKKNERIERMKEQTQFKNGRMERMEEQKECENGRIGRIQIERNAILFLFQFSPPLSPTVSPGAYGGWAHSKCS